MTHMGPSVHLLAVNLLEGTKVRAEGATLRNRIVAQGCVYTYVSWLCTAAEQPLQPKSVMAWVCRWWAVQTVRC